MFGSVLERAVGRRDEGFVGEGVRDALSLPTKAGTVGSDRGADISLDACLGLIRCLRQVFLHHSWPTRVHSEAVAITSICRPEFSRRRTLEGRERSGLCHARDWMRERDLLHWTRGPPDHRSKNVEDSCKSRRGFLCPTHAKKVRGLERRIGQHTTVLEKENKR